RCHLLVSLARARLQKGEAESIPPLLDRARSCDPDSLHLRLPEAELALAREEEEAVWNHAAAVVDQKPALVFHLLPLVERAGPEKGIAFLEARLARAPENRFLRLALARRLQGAGQGDRAGPILWGLLEEVPEWTEVRQAL